MTTLNPKFTKNILTREQAFQLAPDYVKYQEGDFDLWAKIMPVFDKLKRGDVVVTCREKVFLKARVTSINHNDMRAIDGPVVRVRTDEYSWRVDGCDYAYPLEPKKGK